MDDGIRQIPLDQLRVGMYVEDVFTSEGKLLLAANVTIKRQSQIEQLRRQGIRSVRINAFGSPAERTQPARAASAEEIVPETTEPDIRETAYYEELPRAIEIRRVTFETAQKVLSALRKGRSFTYQEVERSATQVVESVMRNSDALVSLCQIKGYDEYTYIHSVNVCILMASLARSMGYRDENLLHVGVGGLLHDIGKMRVPESVLNKPGKYTDWEFAVMKKHPQHGLDIVEGRKSVPETARKTIALHHERAGGTGYPCGLRGKEIDEIGSIAAVADVYDALTSDRVYRAAWTPQRALALIFQGCDREYSRDIVERFTRLLGVYPVGSFVRLNSGEMGVVVKVEPGRLLAPRVLVLFDQAGRRLDEPLTYDLFEKQKENGGNRYDIEMSLNPKAFRIDVGEYLQQQAPIS